MPWDNPVIFNKPRSTIRPEVEPGGYRFTVRDLFIATTLVAVMFALWKASPLYGPPKTEQVIWNSSTGGSVSYGKNDKEYTYLCISKSPDSYTGTDIRMDPFVRSQVLNFGDKMISLSSHPTIIVVDDDGDVHSGPCPLNRKDFQQLIDALESAPLAPQSSNIDSIGVTQEFLRTHREREWPDFVRTILIDP